VKVLPFCAKCGCREAHNIHDLEFPSISVHEFEPCVSLKEVEKYLLSEWNRKSKELRQEYKERDARLAKELLEMVDGVEQGFPSISKAFLAGFRKKVGELRKR